MRPTQQFLKSVALLLTVLALSLGVVGTASRAWSAEAGAKSGPPDFTALIVRLDDDRFEVRDQAAKELARLAAQSDYREPLSRAVHAALNRSELSYEARCRLEILAGALTPVKLAVQTKISDDELDQVVAQLDGDTYADRIGAAARLTSLIEQPGIACRVIERLRPLLRSPTLSRQSRERVEPIWERAQMVWLTSDPKTWQWPKVEPEQIERLLDMLVRPLPPPARDASLEETRARLERKRRLTGRQTAYAELLSLLVRDDLTTHVKSAIDARLAGGQMDDDARQRLTELADWTRPWLAMEGWTEGKVTSVVELPVGLEFLTPMAPRPTLFDRVDERQAHCQTDAALRPGNYPVGVLFPHPSPIRSDAQFVIYNLSTPRSRMAYHYQLKDNRDQRLPELTERTLTQLAAEKRPLKHAEFVMLASLDAHAVSRFAAKYLVAVGDPPAPDKEREERAGRGSPHANLCNLLVEIGTHEAVPGILEAIRLGKLPKPSAKSPANWPWIAVLAILASDPGPDAERVLPGLITRTDALVVGNNLPCDVGATAAAILVDLHGIPLEKFGLELVDDALLAEYGGIGYRFNPPEMRSRVLQWWKDQQAAGTQGGVRRQRSK